MEYFLQERGWHNAIWPEQGGGGGGGSGGCGDCHSDDCVMMVI